MSTSPSPQAAASLPIKEFLAAYYNVHNKDKVKSIPAILRKYAGREEQLRKDIIEKYGNLSPPVTTAANVSASASVKGAIPIPIPVTVSAPDPTQDRIRTPIASGVSAAAASGGGGGGGGGGGSGGGSGGVTDDIGGDGQRPVSREKEKPETPNGNSPSPSPSPSRKMSNFQLSQKQKKLAKERREEEEKMKEEEEKRRVELEEKLNRLEEERLRKEEEEMNMPTEAPPPRLNPRLKARCKAPALISDDEDEDGNDVSEEEESSSDDSDGNSTSSNAERRRLVREKSKAVKREMKEAKRLKKDNPRKHLLHNGKWITKEFLNRKHVPRTGLWACCGDTNPNTLYCPSLDARHSRMVQVAEEQAEDERVVERLKYVSENIKEPWERGELGQNVTKMTLSNIEKALIESSTPQSSYNAPMLVPMIHKNVHEETTVVKGFKFALHHLQDGEGCALLLKHGILEATLKVHVYYFKKHPPLQLECLNVLRQLLECNLTRNAVTANDLRGVNMAFNIAHFHMNSKQHMEAAMRCLMQCCRQEACRVEILRRNMIPYLHNFARRHSKNVSILNSILKIFNWISTTPDRLVELCEMECVQTTMECVKRHSRAHDILSPAIYFLTRASKVFPPALDYVLERKAIPLIINALRALYDDDVLQLEGLKMISTLSKTSEGWKQITETPGGWQSLCQGTSQGNQLVHDLPGELNNPGWCIGDTPHLPMIEKNKMKAQKASEAISYVAPGTSWSTTALNLYMGKNIKQLKLQFNTEYDDAYLEILNSLELLPKHAEDKMDWFKRLSDYEKDNGITLETMTNTVIEMRKKEADDKNRKAQELETREYVKPVIVNGIRITSDYLDVADGVVSEKLRETITDEELQRERRREIDQVEAEPPATH